MNDIQTHLYHISSFIASKNNNKYKTNEHYEKILEQQIDNMDNKLPVLKNFLHPGGSLAAAHLHYARTLTRKTERCYITHIEQTQDNNSSESIGNNINNNNNNNLYGKFFNRLSDYMFVSARFVNMKLNIKDIIMH